MRSEVVHAYLAQHCFFLLLLQVLVGITNATATSKKIKIKTPAGIREIQVHKLWTKVYSQKGLTAMGITQILSWCLSYSHCPGATQIFVLVLKLQSLLLLLSSYCMNALQKFWLIILVLSFDSVGIFALGCFTPWHAPWLGMCHHTLTPLRKQGPH